MSARQMGIDGSVDLVTQQGSSSAAALKASGINVNLAPVADVADSIASFMYKQARTFGFSDTRVARLSTAFAQVTVRGACCPSSSTSRGSAAQP